MTSRISAIQQAAKTTLLSVGQEQPKAQHVSDSPFLPEAINPEPESNELATRAGLSAGAPRSLWQLGIIELTGHNLEARGREEVNRLLHEGWHLLHIYTLRYRDSGVWCERPMAILGRERARDEKDMGSEAGPAAGKVSENSSNASEQGDTKLPAPPTPVTRRGAGRRLHRLPALSEEPKE